jgi:dGTPase
MEHVAHVESVANTVAKYLGLNEELTHAIAFGHDLGHAPFGHYGERVLSSLSKKYLGVPFWHERNGLRFVDYVELLEDNKKINRNLNLTYAVRDGIIAHCGEIDLNFIKPRTNFIDLDDFKTAGQYSPATWEGCVVKLADKIAYIGRDIEDAISLGFLDGDQLEELKTLAAEGDDGALNTTVIMHGVINDVCANSSPDSGICMSEKAFAHLKKIKDFNYRNIYKHKRFKAFEDYASLIINRLFEVLYTLYTPDYVFANLSKEQKYYPKLISSFKDWLAKYCERDILKGELIAISDKCDNRKIYSRLDDSTVYAQAIIDFIAGMTDKFAINLFEEQLSY